MERHSCPDEGVSAASRLNGSARNEATREERNSRRIAPWLYSDDHNRPSLRMRPTSIRRLRYIAISLHGCVGVCACSAQAADALGGSVNVTSDYVYRGISQTEGEPALQADLHYQTRRGWAIGAWASAADVDRYRSAALEVDLYLSRDWMLNRDWNARASLTHYAYPNDVRRLRYDYDELTGTLNYRSRLFTTIAWSPNTSRYSNGRMVRDRRAVSYEVTASQPLNTQWSASAGFGYYDLPTALQADYWFWNVGLACSLGRAQLAVSYIDSSRPAAEAFGYSLAGSRWVGSLAWRF